MSKSKRGFASMSDEQKRAIASKGGKASHKKGTAHEFTPDEAREAGRKGGKAVAADREHMRQIGIIGGHAVSRDRTHMANIGRKGGNASIDDDSVDEETDLMNRARKSGK